MRSKSFWDSVWRQSLAVSIIAAGVGLVLGVLVGLQPLLLCLAIAVMMAVICFFAYFEQTVLGLLVLRSALDIFSDFGIPAAFAIGLDALTIIYIVVALATGQKIITDKFFWFFAAWVGIQSFWLIFMAFGGLGLGASYLSVSIREWIRLFSWLMVYLLVMQLKDKISPKQLINILMFSLVVPILVALVQVIIPSGALPTLLVYGASDETMEVAGEGVRVFGTLGHPNGFAKLLFLFIALTLWQLDCSKKRWFWSILLCTLIFFLVTTQSLFALVMFAVFVVIRAGQSLSLSKLLTGLGLFIVFFALFASTELGVERLNSIADTPLLNPHIDRSQAILMFEGNSFNWRIAQWTYLIEAWQKHPLLGYGLQASPDISPFYSYAHNDYVRALFEGGIVGTISFLVFLGGQLARILHLYAKAPPNSQLRRLCSVLLATFIAFSIGMATDNVWSNTVVYFYWWSILAAAGWDWNDPSDNSAIDYGQNNTAALKNTA